MRRTTCIGAAVCFGAASLAMLGGCKTTINEAEVTTAPVSATTTTVPLPTDTAAQLHEIVSLTSMLGDRVVEGGAGPVLNRINALWAVASTTVGPTDSGLRQQIDVQIAIIQTGVQYKRAADEDKAATNLQAIITTYLQRHPAG